MTTRTKPGRAPVAPAKAAGKKPAPPRASLVERAYREIKSRIMGNIYPPNLQVLEQDLALQLGMSRTPVREALIRLEKEGLVDGCLDILKWGDERSAQFFRRQSGDGPEIAQNFYLSYLDRFVIAKSIFFFRQGQDVPGLIRLV